MVSLFNKGGLLTLAVPCLRRATTLNYTDADEDAEKLLSFLDEVGRSTKGADVDRPTKLQVRTATSRVPMPKMNGYRPTLGVVCSSGGLIATG